jgi:hypothetical protein
MELAHHHGALRKNNRLRAEKSAGISNEIPASLGETPEGDASTPFQE